ncbi:MAG: hypothetical protein LBV72_00490 [Tannerella sp.]|jgi:hypothetical protein|nr:hypothetical protein [Tannerella sp.]
MKKVLTIKVEVDVEHPERQEWSIQNHFVENEMDDAISQILDFTNRKYRNCSGVSASGATKYTVSVKNIKS